MTTDTSLSTVNTAVEGAQGISNDNDDQARERRRLRKKLLQKRRAHGTSPGPISDSSNTTTKKKKHPHNINNHPAAACWAPSQQSLPKLAIQKTKFAVDEECTSLCLAPSGRHVIAGFSDGTLRLFDTTGNLAHNTASSDDECEDDHDDEEEDEYSQGSNNSNSNKDDQSTVTTTSSSNSDSDDSSSYNNSNNNNRRSNSSTSRSASNKRRRTSKRLISTNSSTYGSVLAQICARGVYTKLIMQVGISQDGRFAFGGVLRGNVEMVAVDLSNIEAYHDDDAISSSSLLLLKKNNNKKKENYCLVDDTATTTHNNDDNDIDNDRLSALDLTRVFRHADAKLKGFGACTRLRPAQHNSNSSSSNTSAEYRLFCGRGIKNIHIWRFALEHTTAATTMGGAHWECLLSIPTAGMSVSLLQFRHVQDVNASTSASAAAGTNSNSNKWRLEGVSKSDGVNIRIWDLSAQEKMNHEKEGAITDPTTTTMGKVTASARPKYNEVRNTVDMHGIYGQYAFGGQHNSVGLVQVVCSSNRPNFGNYDIDNNAPKPNRNNHCIFNRTELELPKDGDIDDSVAAVANLANHTTRSSSSRGRRGGGSRSLRTISHVAGISDGAHVVLQASDGAIYHLQNTATGPVVSPIRRHDLTLDPQQQQQPPAKVSLEIFGPSSSPSISTFHVARAGAKGTSVLSVATFDLEDGKGCISLNKLSNRTSEGVRAVSFGESHWGFQGYERFGDAPSVLLKKKKKHKIEGKSFSSPSSPSLISKVGGSAVAVANCSSTPSPTQVQRPKIFITPATTKHASTKSPEDNKIIIQRGNKESPTCVSGQAAVTGSKAAITPSPTSINTAASEQHRSSPPKVESASRAKICSQDERIEAKTKAAVRRMNSSPTGVTPFPKFGNMPMVRPMHILLGNQSSNASTGVMHLNSLKSEMEYAKKVVRSKLPSGSIMVTNQFLNRVAIAPPAFISMQKPVFHAVTSEQALSVNFPGKTVPSAKSSTKVPKAPVKQVISAATNSSIAEKKPQNVSQQSIIKPTIKGPSQLKKSLPSGVSAAVENTLKPTVRFCPSTKSPSRNSKRVGKGVQKKRSASSRSKTARDVVLAHRQLQNAVKQLKQFVNNPILRCTKPVPIRRPIALSSPLNTLRDCETLASKAVCLTKGFVSNCAVNVGPSQGLVEPQKSKESNKNIEETSVCKQNLARIKLQKHHTAVQSKFRKQALTAADRVKGKARINRDLLEGKLEKMIRGLQDELEEMLECQRLEAQSLEAHYVARGYESDVGVSSADVSFAFPNLWQEMRTIALPTID